MNVMKKLMIFFSTCMLCSCVTNSKFQEELILHHNWEDRALALAAEVEEIQGRHKYEMSQMWQLIGSLKADSSQMVSYIKHLETKNPKSAPLIRDLRKLQFLNDSLTRVVHQLKSVHNSSPTVSPTQQNPVADRKPAKGRMGELERFVVQKMKNLPDGKANVKVVGQQLFLNLSDQLIFDSGAIKIESRGIPALSMLAEVLEEFEDFTIIVIGHTDNVPIHRKNIRDNWDLSVLRASSIVRSLVNDYRFAPTRIIAAGHGEYDPVTQEDSAYARAKNRRIEIVLTHTSMVGHASL